MSGHVFQSCRKVTFTESGLQPLRACLQQSRRAVCFCGARKRQSFAYEHRRRVLAAPGRETTLDAAGAWRDGGRGRRGGDADHRTAFLLLSSVFYILTGIGLGLFISTVSSTQQEAFMSMFFFFLPAIMLSGFMFPIENMPRVLQYVTYLDPLRYFLEIVRGVFLRGAGWRILWPQALVLAAMGALVITAATRRFRKTAG